MAVAVDEVAVRVDVGLGPTPCGPGPVSCVYYDPPGLGSPVPTPTSVPSSDEPVAKATPNGEGNG